VMLKGIKQIKTNLVYMIPMVIFMAVINPVFNHEGITVIGYMPDGNPITTESIAYGIVTAVMIVSVICHFFCYNEVMTSDKFIYLFGKIIPALSLVISMTLRFIPRLIRKFKEVSNAQKCIGRGLTEGNALTRLKNGITILSIVTTWSLENAVETSDSMKSRGYGIRGRTNYSIFKLGKRDIRMLAMIVITGGYVLAGAITGKMDFNFFPSIQYERMSAFNISVFFAYFILCMSPVIIEIMEVRKWKS